MTAEMTREELPAVRFRAIEPEDLDVLYKIENDTSLWNVGVTNVPYSKYMLHEYIAGSSGDIYADKQVRMIISNDAGDILCVVDLTDFDPRHRRAELGIVIQCPFRGRHYAQAAIERIKAYARDILLIHQLYAYVDCQNSTALRTFENCGFISSITLKDWLFDGKKYREAVLMQYFL